MTSKCYTKIKGIQDDLQTLDFIEFDGIYIGWLFRTLWAHCRQNDNVGNTEIEVIQFLHNHHNLQYLISSMLVRVLLDISKNPQAFIGLKDFTFSRRNWSCCLSLASQEIIRFSWIFILVISRVSKAESKDSFKRNFISNEMKSLKSCKNKRY